MSGPSCFRGVLGAVEEGGREALVGVQVGPAVRAPLIYANDPSNIKIAIMERIDKKKKQVNWTRAEKARVGKVVYAAVSDKNKHAIWTTQKIAEWGIKHDLIGLTDCKSGKWTPDRLQRAVDGLATGRDLEKMQMSASIKLEMMPDGKPPRMLIADGDKGQVLALAVICCFEDLLFEHMEERSLKHVSKDKGMERICHTLSFSKKKIDKLKGKICMIGGDGSAWDTTCSATVRATVENPVLRKIMEVLAKLEPSRAGWMKAHQKACEQPVLDLIARTKDILGERVVHFKIDAIRRSGHRGTSCLNWWINFVLWHAVMFKEPELFLDPAVEEAEDVWGELRPWKSAFEGDDSGLATIEKKHPKGEAPAMMETRAKDIMEAWDRFGFNMKLEYAHEGEHFKIVGWDVLVGSIGLNGTRAPELRRCLEGIGYSCSTEARMAFMRNDDKALKGVAASKFAARAWEFREYYPTVAGMFMRVAEYHGLGGQLTYDDRMRVGFDESMTLEQIRQAVCASATKQSHSEEAKRANALGYPCEIRHLEGIALLGGEYLANASIEEMRTHLPTSFGGCEDARDVA